MTQSRRLLSGGRINRSQPVTFRFNGKKLKGYSGDSVASALLANNVSIVGRSFKYHRARGIVGSGAEETNAILQVGTDAHTIPNLRATQIEIYDDLRVSTVNCWPNEKFDIYSALRIGAAMLPAGFYYKTFMSPGKLWPWYERGIRRMAGFGVAPAKPDPNRYDKLNAWCDVLVAGGGPAGIAAAVSAARCGARVILADEQSEFGGGLLRLNETYGNHWIWQGLAELSDNPNIRLLPRCTVTGYYDNNFLVLNERLTDHLAKPSRSSARERLWRVRAKQVVIATGAIERPLVFGNNDLPGVMLASAASTYINRYAVRPGRKAVIFTNNNSAYRTALDFLDAGMQLVAVVDARANPEGKSVDLVRKREVYILPGSAVVSARGSKRITSVNVMHLSEDGSKVSGEITLNCDLLAVSGGWSPAVHLHAQSGARPVFDESKACFLPGEAVQNQMSVGAANGEFGLSESVKQGLAAGTEAAQAAGYSPSEEQSYGNSLNEQDEPLNIRPLWLVPKSNNAKKAKRFVDFQNDTTAEDIMLAAKEGYHSIELVKRYTALGFGTDQGKMGNVNGMAILSQSLQQDIVHTGTTTFRPMYTPVTFGAIAARDIGVDFFEPVRKTAMHRWHERHAAEFENVGQWKRPWYYPKPGETMHQAVNRECLAARNQVAMLDASTLGKIEVFGPDSEAFLNRIYTNSISSLVQGSCRYGFMLGEDGMVMDDGVVGKLNDNHYYLTTTTGGAAHVLSWLELWQQTEWPSMRVYFTSVTDQWAVISISGPKSRELLSKLVERDEKISKEDFSFMSFRELEVAGVKARVFRISFSGELSYEINVPANYGHYVWEQIYAAGQEFGITPYGTESMHILRAEKGFVIVGQDTDGSVTPIDLGMEWIVSKKKDCIGKRSLARSDCTRPDRKQFVGLATQDPKKVLPEGAQLVEQPASSYPVPMIGHVTSSYWSETLGKSIALAVVKGGRSRMGKQIFAFLVDGETVPVTVCSTVFYDPEGARQNVD